MFHVFIIHSSFDEHSDFFHIQVNASRSALNLKSQYYGIETFVRSDMGEPHSILRNLHTDFQSDFISLYSPPKNKISLSLYLRVHLLALLFF